ncbi:hypothetical protein AB0P21_07365 [Kribbella sp. NPDC056861]|uniref:hypothetical protein n=1 Tax=Kribbella sp. NPDC056861 TaxID=3154857 RepID=UPI00344938DD
MVRYDLSQPDLASQQIVLCEPPAGKISLLRRVDQRGAAVALDRLRQLLELSGLCGTTADRVDQASPIDVVEVGAGREFVQLAGQPRVRGPDGLPRRHGRSRLPGWLCVRRARNRPGDGCQLLPERLELLTALGHGRLPCR